MNTESKVKFLSENLLDDYANRLEYLMSYNIPERKEDIYIVTERQDYFVKKKIWNRFMSNEEALQWASEQPILQVDVETNMLEHFNGGKMWCVQIGRPDKQIIIDLETIPIKDSEWANILEWNDKIIIGHGFDFDWVWLAKEDICIRSENLVDTLVAENSISLGMDFERRSNGEVISRYERNLGAVGKRWLGITLSKEEQSEIADKGLSEEKFVLYSGRDVMNLEHILREQLKVAEQKGTTIDIMEESANTVAVGYMTYCGIYLHWEDSDRNNMNWSDKCEKDDARFVQAQMKLDEYCREHHPQHIEYYDKYKEMERLGVDTSLYVPGKMYKTDERGRNTKEPITFQEWIEENYPEVTRHKLPRGYNHLFSWGSSKKVEELFRALGINTYNDKSKKYSVQANILEPQKSKFGILPLYLEVAKSKKVCSTYGREWKNAIQSETGRIHTKFRLAVSTGRMASGGGKNQYAVNIQNLPNDNFTRGCFRGQGSNYVAFLDFSDQEGNVSANESGDEGLLDFYNKGKGDKHAFVASMVWGLSFEEIKEAKDKKERGEQLTEEEASLLKYRSLAKAVGFALMYGGNAFTVANNVGISKEEAERVEELFFKAFPGIKDFIDKQRKQVHVNREILINKITGKKRYFDELPQVDTYKERIKEIEAMKNGRIGAIFKDRIYMRTKWKKALEQMAKKKNGSKERAEALWEEYQDITRSSRIFWSSSERAAINTPIQGTAAIITKRAMRYFTDHVLYSRRTKSSNLFGKWMLINAVHDELGIEAHHKSIKKAMEVLRECMVVAAKDFCPKLDMAAQGEDSKYWVH